MLTIPALLIFFGSIYAANSKCIPTNLATVGCLIWGCICSAVYLIGYLFDLQVKQDLALMESVLCVIAAILCQTSHEFIKVYQQAMER